jgi:hypothetical protein
VKPRLRFDKEARRLVSDVETAARSAIPDGTTVVFTVTAPIRQASKTTAAIIEHIHALLAQRAKQAEIKRTINGNSVRIRVRHSGSKRTPKILGFVHNPDPGAAKTLLDEALPSTSSG